MNTKFKLILAISIALNTLSGCGGGGSSSGSTKATGTTNPNKTGTTHTVSTTHSVKTGYFIDAEVIGVEYKTSSGRHGKTNSKGQFFYNAGDEVSFNIGKLALGKAKPDADGVITPWAMCLNIAKGNHSVAKEKESLLLRVLQSLDVDHNPEKGGIRINPKLHEDLKYANPATVIELTENNILDFHDALRAELDKNSDGLIDVSADIAHAHAVNGLGKWNVAHGFAHNAHDNAHGYAQDVYGTVHDHAQDVHGTVHDHAQDVHGTVHDHAQDVHGTVHDHAQDVHGTVHDHAQDVHGTVHDHAQDVHDTVHDHAQDVHDTVHNHGFSMGKRLSTLKDDQKYALAYMWNEERLAKDIYLALNSLYPVKQFENIAESEAKHLQAVEGLVEKYNVNIENMVDYTNGYSAEQLNTMAPGSYAIESVQNLYNELYAKGENSKVDALQVGCMVEVTDIEDLENYIAVAQQVNAVDLVSVFENIKTGSYQHYWAFDKALKAEGIAEGCASLGSEYAKTSDESIIESKGQDFGQVMASGFTR